MELRGDDAARKLVAQMKVATEEDWHTEYLAPILSVRVVAGLDEAIEHINTYGSQHTDSIVTENYTRAMRFLREVDSSSVMVNASTRFADGFEYGLGAEIGISTDKIHARGPVGLEGLTSQKYIVLGNGQIRIKRIPASRRVQHDEFARLITSSSTLQNVNSDFKETKHHEQNHRSQSTGHRRLQGCCRHRNSGQSRATRSKPNNR